MQFLPKLTLISAQHTFQVIRIASPSLCLVSETWPQNWIFIPYQSHHFQQQHSIKSTTGNALSRFTGSHPHKPFPKHHVSVSYRLELLLDISRHIPATIPHFGRHVHLQFHYPVITSGNARPPPFRPSWQESTSL